MDTTFLAQDGDSLYLEPVLDDAGGVAGHRHGAALDTRPCAHAAVPAHDGVHDTGVVLDLGILQHNGLLDAGAAADGGAGANGNIGPQLRGGVNGGAGVDKDGRDDVGRGRGQLLGAVLPGLLQVQGVGRDGGARSLDLSPKVLCLVHKELLRVGHVAKNVLLEADDLALALVVLVVRVEHEGALQILGGGIGGEAGPVGAALHGALDGREDDVGAE